MSTYFLKKNLAQLMRQPKDAGATPTADRMVAQTAAGVARRNNRLVTQAKNRQLRQVQFDRNIDLRRDRLDVEKDRAATEKKQGRLALAIGAGNVAATAAGGIAKRKRQDRMDQYMEKMMDLKQSMVTLQGEFNKKYLSLFK